jgi:hypothetical protein
MHEETVDINEAIKDQKLGIALLEEAGETNIGELRILAEM